MAGPTKVDQIQNYATTSILCVKAVMGSSEVASQSTKVDTTKIGSVLSYSLHYQAKLGTINWYVMANIVHKLRHKDHATLWCLTGTSIFKSQVVVNLFGVDSVYNI
jgi:hypothetical protein